MLEAEAAVTLATGEPKGLLRITAPADIGDTILSRVVSRMRHTYPKVRVDLVLTSQFVDLVAEGIDVAIRAGDLNDASLIARKIGIARWVAFASPEYLSSAPELTNPQQLRHHKCLQFTPLGKEGWTLSNDTGSLTVPMPGNILINNVGLIRAIALMGEGIALLPTYLCRLECEAGSLVRVLPEWHAKADSLSIVYPKQRFVPPKLRAFIDILIDEMRDEMS